MKQLVQTTSVNRSGSDFETRYKWVRVIDTMIAHGRLGFTPDFEVKAYGKSTIRACHIPLVTSNDSSK